MGMAEKDYIYMLWTGCDLQVRSCLPLSPVQDFTACYGRSSIPDWRVSPIVSVISIVSHITLEWSLGEVLSGTSISIMPKVGAITPRVSTGSFSSGHYCQDL